MYKENVFKIMEENWQKYVPLSRLTSEEFSDLDPAFIHYKAQLYHHH